jgi:plastocyanin
MDNKKKIILALGFILILALLVVILWQFKFGSQMATPVVETGNQFVPDANQSSSTPRDWAETDVRKAVPEGVVVPEMTTVVPDNLKNQIAVPTATVPVVEGSSAQIRMFNVRAETDKFIPEKIIVNKGDTVHIEFTAVDKDYDFTLSGYGMKQAPKQGETKSLEFQALQDGDFIYYCAACGGLQSGPQGHIIVVK